MPSPTSKFPSYGLVRGPSHEQGGVAGMVADEQPVELEGGEWIIPKEAVPDYLPVLQQITNEGRAMQQMDNGNSAMDALIASASMHNGLAQPKSPMYQEGGNVLHPRSYATPSFLMSDEEREARTKEVWKQQYADPYPGSGFSWPTEAEMEAMSYEELGNIPEPSNKQLLEWQLSQPGHTPFDVLASRVGGDRWEEQVNPKDKFSYEMRLDHAVKHQGLTDVTDKLVLDRKLQEYGTKPEHYEKDNPFSQTLPESMRLYDSGERYTDRRTEYDRRDAREQKAKETAMFRKLQAGKDSWEFDKRRADKGYSNYTKDTKDWTDSPNITKIMDSQLYKDTMSRKVKEQSDREIKQIEDLEPPALPQAWVPGRAPVSIEVSPLEKLQHYTIGYGNPLAKGIRNLIGKQKQGGPVDYYQNGGEIPSFSNKKDFRGFLDKQYSLMNVSPSNYDSSDEYSIAMYANPEDSARAVFMDKVSDKFYTDNRKKLLDQTNFSSFLERSKSPFGRYSDKEPAIRKDAELNYLKKEYGDSLDDFLNIYNKKDIKNLNIKKQGGPVDYYQTGGQVQPRKQQEMRDAYIDPQDSSIVTTSPYQGMLFDEAKENIKWLPGTPQSAMTKTILDIINRPQVYNMPSEKDLRKKRFIGPPDSLVGRTYRNPFTGEFEDADAQDKRIEEQIKRLRQRMKQSEIPISKERVPMQEGGQVQLRRQAEKNTMSRQPKEKMDVIFPFLESIPRYLYPDFMGPRSPKQMLEVEDLFDEILRNAKGDRKYYIPDYDKEETGMKMAQEGGMVSNNNLMGSIASDQKIAPLQPDVYQSKSENGVTIEQRVEVPKLAEAILPIYGLETPLSKNQGSMLKRNNVTPNVLNPQVKGLINRVLVQRLAAEGS